MNTYNLLVWLYLFSGLVHIRRKAKSNVMAFINNNRDLKF